MAQIKLLHLVYKAYVLTESSVNLLIERTCHELKNVAVYSMIKPADNSSKFDYNAFHVPLFKLISLSSLLFLLTHIPFSVQYIFLKKTQNITWVKTNILNLLRFAMLFKLIKKEHITHVHFHFGFYGELFIQLKKFAQIKTIVSFYGFDTSSILLPNFKNVKTHCDSLLVLSNFMKNDLIKAGYKDGKIQILKLALKFSTMPLAEKIKRKDQIVFTGRFVAKKAPIEAIEAFSIFHKENPKFHFVMIGDGPEYEKANEKVKELSLQKFVTFCGAQDPVSTFKYMREAKIFFIPSKTAPDGDKEGTPMVILEAQLLGLPVVSTRHAGIPEIVREGETALLSDEGDINSMADSINNLLSDTKKWKAFSEAAQKYASENYNVVSRAKTLLNIYQQL